MARRHGRLLVVFCLLSLAFGSLDNKLLRPMLAAEEQLVALAKDQVITASPLVVELKPSRALARRIISALSAEPPRSVKLTLADVVPPSNGTAIAVYANLPEPQSPADLEETSHYWAGAIEFQPRGRKRATQSFNLDLAEPLAQQLKRGRWRGGDPIRITLRAVGDSAHQLSTETTIPVAKVAISVDSDE